MNAPHKTYGIQRAVYPFELTEITADAQGYEYKGFDPEYKGHLIVLTGHTMNPDAKLGDRGTMKYISTPSLAFWYFFHETPEEKTAYDANVETYHLGVPHADVRISIASAELLARAALAASPTPPFTVAERRRAGRARGHAGGPPGRFDEQLHPLRQNGDG